MVLYCYQRRNKGKAMTTIQKFTTVKSQVPDGMIVFFKMGNFFECYYGDARIVSMKLGLSLHNRVDVPCVGVPYHAIYRIQDELEKNHHIKSIVVAGNGDFNS